MRSTVHIRREIRCSAAGKRLAEAARAALRQDGASFGEMTVVLTDDRRMRRLNARFAGEDAVTDVLAFPDQPPAASPGYLGDVVIAVPRVRRQARRRRLSVTDELQLLVIHGTLHLLGHDHRRPGERRRMWEAQAGALRRIGLDPARMGVAP